MNRIEPYKIRLDERYEITFDELINVNIEALTPRCETRLARFGPPMYVREEIARKRQHMGYLYLIHFTIPYKHARHYLGFTKDLPARLMQHRIGQGANLMRVIEEAGIPWKVSRLWVGDRYLERSLKNTRNVPKLCPVCRQAEQYALREPSNIEPSYELREQNATGN